MCQMGPEWDVKSTIKHFAMLWPVAIGITVCMQMRRLLQMVVV